MDIGEEIQKLGDFFEANYKAEIMKLVRAGKDFIVVDFSDLLKFDPDIANELLEQPNEVLEAAEEALKNVADLNVKRFHIRFTNLPDSQKILIRNIRSNHIGAFLLMEGVVRQKSDVRPQVTSARFECPSCGNVISILQLDESFREPSKCGCGRKGKFRLLGKELVDAQGLVLEEDPENLEGGEQPKRINVLLKDDLVSPMSERKTNPGSKIYVVGQVKEVPIITRRGTQSIRFDLVVEANFVEAAQEDFYEVEINEEEEKKIKEIAKSHNVHKRVIDAIAPSIFGHERVKEALALQLIGGVNKSRSDGVVTRGDIHVLLVGDPGAGKCAVGSTKIMLDNGAITNIKSICDNKSGNVFSLSEKGSNFTSKPLRYWRRKAPKKILKIITNSGNELMITKEHPLFTTQNGLIFAKKAEEIEKGEYLALPSKLEVKGALQRIPKDIVKTKANNKVKYVCKEYLDQDFARLLGYLVGDGYVKFRTTTGLISFTNLNQELLDDFERLIKNVFDLNVSKRRKHNSSSSEYYVSSIELVRILEKIDPNIVKRSSNMSISNLICKSPKKVLKEFIKSLFDCEGHVRKDRKEIDFSSKSKDLVHDLKYVLLRFGIISQISICKKCATNTKAKIKRDYYRLRISGENVLKYAREIGFVSKDKNKSIRFDKSNNTNIDVVPNLKELLLVLRRKYGLTQSSYEMARSTYQHYERGDRFPSYKKLKLIFNKYKNFDDPLVEVLKQISHSDVFWDKIKTKELVDCEEDYVYDLEIDKVHNYVANGVVIHNSQLLKRAHLVAPKGRYVSGKGVSGAGLTASVVKDEFLKGWSLEAGALVLANKGVCCIDEMDKMSHEDRSAMHEALEQQTVSISKANIQATLVCKTTVLAAANPKLGRFDPYDILAKQIDLPPALINRFDLIFTIRDMPDEQKDEKLASHILGLHRNPDVAEGEIDTDLLKKYFAFARQKCRPKLTEGALEEIKKYYVSMRNQDKSEDGGIRAVPISARQLEALTRLAEASAKLRLSEKVTKADAKRGIDILHYCLSEIGVDPETGKIDIDRISSGITASQRNKIVIVKELIEELEEKIGKTIPLDDLVKEAEEKGIKDIDEVIEKLKRSGDIFEPKRGFIQRI